jgi:hypothetical protein
MFPHTHSALLSVFAAEIAVIGRVRSDVLYCLIFYFHFSIDISIVKHKKQPSTMTSLLVSVTAIVGRRYHELR